MLLEYDVKSGEGVTPPEAIGGLLLAEGSFKRGVVGDSTFALVLSRLGRQDAALRAGEFSELSKGEYGEPPHCLVVPGSLHFTETEAIAAVFSVAEGKVHGNSGSVKRTAQTLVPKYVAKASKALREVRDRLGPQYGAVLENAELYLRDAENFLANGQDELAMLSVGYAEGLLDSLAFAGVVKIDW